MILESGMNLFTAADMCYEIKNVTASEAQMGQEIDFTIKTPFKKGGSLCKAYCYATNKEPIAFTGTAVVLSLYISSKASGGSYLAANKINVANITLADLKQGDSLFDFYLPSDTLQVVKLTGKLTGTTPVITSGKIFGNLEPKVS